MKRRLFVLSRPCLVALMFLNACGTRDYPSDPPVSDPQASRSRNPDPRAPPSSEPRPPDAQAPQVSESRVPEPRAAAQPEIVHPPPIDSRSLQIPGANLSSLPLVPPIEQNLAQPQPPPPGYLWGGLSWVRVPGANISSFQNSFANGPMVNQFAVNGVNLLGGAALGILIQSSNDLYFGAPPKLASFASPFERLVQRTKTIARSAAGGSLLALSCQFAAEGTELLSFPGFLGEKFSALASSAEMGVMSSVAAAPYIRKMMSREFVSKLKAKINFGPPRNTYRRSRGFTKIVDGVVYRLGPGVAAIGIGAGIAILIYQWLNGEDIGGDHPASKKPS